MGSFFLEEGGLLGTQNHSSSIFPSSFNINLLFAYLVWVLLYFWPIYSQVSNFHVMVKEWALEILRIFWLFIWGMSFHLFQPSHSSGCSSGATMVVHGLGPLISPAAYLLAAMLASSEMTRKWPFQSRAQAEPGGRIMSVGIARPGRVRGSQQAARGRGPLLPRGPLCWPDPWGSTEGFSGLAGL